MGIDAGEFLPAQDLISGQIAKWPAVEHFITWELAKILLKRGEITSHQTLPHEHHHSALYTRRIGFVNAPGQPYLESLRVNILAAGMWPEPTLRAKNNHTLGRASGRVKIACACLLREHRRCSPALARLEKIHF